MKQLFTFLAILASVIVVIVFTLQGKQSANQAASTPAAVTQPGEAAVDTAATEEGPSSPTATGEVKTIEAAATAIVEPSAEKVKPAQPVEQVTYHVVGADKAEVSTIGSNDPASGYKLKVELSGWGASIYNVYLTDYEIDTDHKTPYLIQTVQQVINADGSTSVVFPFAAYQITVDDQTLSLSDVAWRKIGKGVYQVTLADENNLELLRITRTYSLQRGDAAYSIVCRQSIANLSDRPIDITWDQFAHADLVSRGAYEKLRDQRSIIAGYYDLEYDLQRLRVATDHTYKRRTEMLDHWDKRRHETDYAVDFWPNSELPAKRELVWLASTNRYFASAVHRVMPDAATAPTYAPKLDAIFPKIRQSIFGYETEEADNRVLMMRLATDEITLAPKAVQNFDVALYTGPRSVDVFKQYPYATLDLKRILKYDLGCTICTFQPIARFLLGFLKVIHVVTFDWAIAIVVLVLTVRLVLHPLTKKSQINMMKMSRAMQTLQPEIEKLKLKYKNDQQTLNREMMSLYKEKGVNPANFLGCAPMLIQMPIWVALYAMLYFAIELRSEPAFYGIFQAISGGNWGFLADLSSPDRFITFSDQPISINFPLLESLDFSSFNILPILMGIMYFLQQQLMTPPATNEQAAQQQKMMKWMMLLFPVFLYSAPSGLTLYILASSAAGIADSYIVRRHVKQMEEDGTLFEKKQPKPGGFTDRLQKFAEARQQMMEQQQKQRDMGSPRSKRKR